MSVCHSWICFLETLVISQLHDVCKWAHLLKENVFNCLNSQVQMKYLRKRKNLSWTSCRRHSHSIAVTISVAKAYKYSMTMFGCWIHQINSGRCLSSLSLPYFTSMLLLGWVSDNSAHQCVSDDTQFTVVCFSVPVVPVLHTFMFLKNSKTIEEFVIFG